MKCFFRRAYAAAELAKQFPPVLQDPNKQVAFELAMQVRPPAGEIVVTRWHPLALPAEVGAERVEEVVLAGYYDYAASAAATWHVNFADPNLFVAYGSGLLAQDELQCVEHPALGSIREALEHAEPRRVDRRGSRPDARARRERRAPLHARDRREPRATVRTVRQPVRARGCRDDP